MRATDDEIREKYLERAIRELNLLAHAVQDCELCPRGGVMPVLGSGKTDYAGVRRAALESLGIDKAA